MHGPIGVGLCPLLQVLLLPLQFLLALLLHLLLLLQLLLLRLLLGRCCLGRDGVLGRRRLARRGLGECCTSSQRAARDDGRNQRMMKRHDLFLLAPLNFGRQSGCVSRVSHWAGESLRHPGGKQAVREPAWHALQDRVAAQSCSRHGCACG